MISVRAPIAITVAMLATISMASAASADDKTDEYRLTVFPTHPIMGRNDLIGIGYLGYVDIPETETTTTYLGAGAIWKFSKWGEIWGIVLSTKTESETSTDIDELRPVVGLKANFAKVGSTTFYNFFRVEYRIQDRDTGTDTEYFRIRNRLGLERPFGKQPYGLKTWYGMADIENFYRFDRNFSDLARLRLGAGYVLNDRVRVEFLYHMQFKRADSGDNFKWTDNIYRVNFKVGFKQGLLGRVFDGGGDLDAD
jgi:hypothetical protein